MTNSELYDIYRRTIFELFDPERDKEDITDEYNQAISDIALDYRYEDLRDWQVRTLYAALDAVKRVRGL